MVKKVVSQADLEREFRAAGDKAVLVDFYATWCGPCKTISPKLVELSSKYPSVTVLKVDVDQSEAIANKYKVNCMPTFKVFIRGQEVRGSTVASASVSQLENLFKTYK